jgi:hypothetical protein
MVLFYVTPFSKMSASKASYTERLINLMLGLYAALLVWIGFGAALRPPTSDTGWLLFAAREALQGKAIYTELAETNPPLILWYKMLAVSLSPEPVSDIAVFIILVMAVSVISIGASCLIVKKSGVLTARQLWLFAAVLSAIALPLAVHEMVFAQREHLVILFCLPYLAYSIPEVFSRYQPSRASIIMIAVWAAMGLLLKPHFAMIFLAIESAFLLLIRRIDSKRFLLGITVTALGLVYALSVWKFLPAYYTEIVADMLRTYDAHRNPDGVVYFRLLSEFSAYMVLVPFIIGLPQLFWRRNMLPFVFAAFAGIAVILIQDKGWYYTYYPLRAVLYLALAYLFWGICSQPHQWKNASNKYSIFLITLILALVSVGYQHAPIGWFFYLLYGFIPLLVAFLYGLTLIHEKAPAHPARVWLFWLSFIPVLGLMAAYFTGVLIPIHIVMTLWIAALLLSAANLYFAKGKIFLSSATIQFALACICFWLMILIPMATYVRAQMWTMLVERGLSDALAEKINAKDAKTIYFFNTNLYPAWPLSAMLGTKWGGRYHHLWMLPALYHRSGCRVRPELADIESRMMRHLEEDFKKSKPDLLIFDTSPRKFISNRVRYDYRLCMSKNKGLARIFEHYEYVSHVNICGERIKLNCSYDIYRKFIEY